MRKPGDVTEVGTIVSETKAFDHPFFPVVERVIRTPDGTTRDPQLLWDRGGKTFVVAVVTDPQGRYVVVEEPKYGQMLRMISAPAGGIKKGEHPIDAAKREFLEETGYEAEGWEILANKPVVDFADKIDGGHHFIVRAKNARKVGEPKEAAQKVLTLEPGVLLWSAMVDGYVPAVSMAAILLAGALTGVDYGIDP